MASESLTASTSPWSCLTPSCISLFFRISSLSTSTNVWKGDLGSSSYRRDDEWKFEVCKTLAARVGMEVRVVTTRQWWGLTRLRCPARANRFLGNIFQRTVNVVLGQGVGPRPINETGKRPLRHAPEPIQIEESTKTKGVQAFVSYAGKRYLHMVLRSTPPGTGHNCLMVAALYYPWCTFRTCATCERPEEID
jgi:hypothetical protein